MTWRALATGFLALHFAFLGFVVFGGFLAWRWPRLVPVHLLALAWALGSITVHYDCPLTAAADACLRRAGDHPAGNFVDRYVEGVVVPHGHDRVVQAVALGLIVVSYAVLMRRQSRRGCGVSRVRVGVPATETPGGTTPVARR